MRFVEIILNLLLRDAATNQGMIFIERGFDRQKLLYPPLAHSWQTVWNDMGLPISA
jgi:hypothetical protein